jgi:hypothetical protein
VRLDGVADLDGAYRRGSAHLAEMPACECPRHRRDGNGNHHAEETVSCRANESRMYRECHWKTQHRSESDRQGARDPRREYEPAPFYPDLLERRHAFSGE